MVASGRKQLVGLVTDDPKLVLDGGAQIVDDPASDPDADARPRHVELLEPELRPLQSPWPWWRTGARSRAPLHVTNAGGFCRVTVVDPVFFDPKGERIHA